MGTTSQSKEKLEDYEAFVNKFKPKKTTDDCYTPKKVYDAVQNWVSVEYNIKQETFCRPFYPGGDYEHFDYKNRVVVDNPPFSILSKIVKFYTDNDIKFFLFAPTFTSCRYGDYCTVLPVGVDITYENGAAVNTSFVTNLEPYETRVKTVPSLYEAVSKANKTNLAIAKKQCSKIIYPPGLITIGMIYSYSKYGIVFTIPRTESMRISALDAQRPSKGIFGGGWLISQEVQAEQKAAEQKKQNILN